MIELRGVEKIYPDGNIHALRGIDLRINPGEMVALMGPSGCGKSTLLNLIGSLDLPTRGTVEVFGQSLDTRLDAVRYRSQVVSFIFQAHNLFPTLTAAENVELPLFEHPLSRRERRHRALELLEQVGLGEKANQLPRNLSGGQRQRVAVARALATRPRVVLADEPTGALDSATRDEVMELLVQFNRSMGTTFLIVTHDADVAAVVHRTLRMRDGSIAASVPLAAPGA